ncbi:ATP-binding protein [Bradyrhizobium sp. S3.12.5]|uniref:ATP-binding protein n=1 Tax=Bradyrhizobium sp. S3.12.5 TaxID=3156386 RepID=UPI003390BEDB
MNSPERFIAMVDDFRRLDSEMPCVEFKNNNYDPERIGRLISAISNAARIADQHCGYVLWGIDDESHEVVGTNFKPSAQLAHGQPLELWLSRALTPSLHFRFIDVEHPSGRIVLLEIPAAVSVPTKFNHIPYVRVGPATPKLSDHASHEASLLAKLRPFAWEQGVAAAFVTVDEVLDLLDTDAYFTLTSQALPGAKQAIAKVLEHDKLIASDVGGRWNVLNLGAVLFARDMSKFPSIARKAARVIKYDGISRTAEARDQIGIRGYAIAFEGLINYINNILPKNASIGRALRTAKPEYPELAIRELVANALVHQDMTIPGTAPVIEIFSDRVEITNPGTPLVETNRFIDFPPRSRNETLASLMRRVGVCEEQGSGIDKVVEEVETSHLPPPDFRADGNNTKVTIFGKKSFAEMTPDERLRGTYQHATIRYINNLGGLTNGSLRVRFGVPERNASQISKVLKQAMDAGLIRQSENWSAKSGFYLPYWA